ncbi:transposase, partial [Gluconobacter potus]
GTFPATDLAISFFGYKSHASIDRKFRLIRKWNATDAISNDGARLREGLLDRSNTASDIWAETAYRSNANEDFMGNQGFVSKVHREKPHLKSMPRHIQRSNAGKSVVRSRVTMRIGMVNIVYNMRRCLFLKWINADA